MRVSDSHLRARIKDAPGAYALLVENAKRAVVFVHGFFGSAYSTWRKFQELVDDSPDDKSWWGESDLYFYSYASWRQIDPQGTALRKFLSNVFDKDINACPILYSYVDHSGFCVTTTLKFRRRYKELVLVGHSTGGLIIRSAILEEIDATKERLKARHGSVLDDELKKLPVLKSAVRLFAPVHLGAICSGKLAVARHLPVSERLTAVLLKSSPLFQNIQPESKLLDRIRENTETLTTKYGWMRSLRADLLFGYDDAIVTIGKYDTDPMLTKLKDHSHTSICKPNAKYTIPLEFVVDAERIRAKHL